MKNLTAVFEEAKEGGYVCWFEEVPEAMSQGETRKEAKQNLLDAFKLIMEYRHEQAEKQLKKLRTRKVNVTTQFIPLSSII